MLFCSVAYATDIVIVEPPTFDSLPLGVSSLDDLPPIVDEMPIEPPPYSDLDTNALLEAILSRIDFILFTLLPFAVAVLVVWFSCRWFNWSFLDNDYFQ